MYPPALASPQVSAAQRRCCGVAVASARPFPAVVVPSAGQTSRRSSRIPSRWGRPPTRPGCPGRGPLHRGAQGLEGPVRSPALCRRESDSVSAPLLDRRVRKSPACPRAQRQPPTSSSPGTAPSTGSTSTPPRRLIRLPPSAMRSVAVGSTRERKADVPSLLPGHRGADYISVSFCWNPEGAWRRPFLTKPCGRCVCGRQERGPTQRLPSCRRLQHVAPTPSMSGAASLARAEGAFGRAGVRDSEPARNHNPGAASPAATLPAAQVLAAPSVGKALAAAVPAGFHHARATRVTSVPSVAVLLDGKRTVCPGQCLPTSRSQQRQVHGHQHYSSSHFETGSFHRPTSRFRCEGRSVGLLGSTPAAPNQLPIPTGGVVGHKTTLHLTV
jgi:hypothetical protein